MAIYWLQRFFHLLYCSVERLGIVVKDLLEVLAEKSGCMFISDLRTMTVTRRLVSALEEINPDDFSLAEWNNVAHYLTSDQISFASCEEAQHYLMSYQKRLL
jgi:hypothetical protein